MPSSITCQDCGYIFQGDDVDQESGKRKPCPKCGSLKRTFIEKAEIKIRVVAKAVVSKITEVHMTTDSWTILGLILAFIIPPMFYAVFSLLTICFLYQILVWLGIAIIIFLLTRTYIVIISLKYLANTTKNKHKTKDE